MSAALGDFGVGRASAFVLANWTHSRTASTREHALRRGPAAIGKVSRQMDQTGARTARYLRRQIARALAWRYERTHGTSSRCRWLFLRGLIEEVEIDIPWTKLKTESVVVKLHSPVLLLAPHSEGEWDSADGGQAPIRPHEKQHELQKLRDAAAPVTANAATSAPIEDSGEKGFLEKLIARAIDNAQILITSALIRFEDYSHADEPFGLEVAFDSLWIHREHVKAPVPGGGVAAGAGGKDEKERPLAHREALVCALCAYILDSTSLPPTTDQAMRLCIRVGITALLHRPSSRLTRCVASQCAPMLPGTLIFSC